MFNSRVSSWNKSASAQMVGYTVIPVKSLSNGDIDLVDFETKAKENEID